MKRNLAALMTLGLLLCLSCGERETKLFNGKDLTGWTFHVQADSTATAEDVFGVKDGVITIAGQPFGSTSSGAGPGSRPTPASSCTPSPSTPSGPAAPRST